MRRLFPAVVLCLHLIYLSAYPAEDATRTVSEERLLSNIRQVTFEGRRAGEGYFGADGRRLVFQSEREPGNPFFQIYLLDLETGDTQRISPGTGKTTCAWIHPDGDRVLFASTHHDPDAVRKQGEELEFRASGQERRYSWDYDEQYELYEADLETGELRRLTHALGYDAEGSWSPDGRWILFSSNRHAYEENLSEREKALFEKDKSYLLDLYIMDADGDNLRRLTDLPGYDGGPFFSSDGSRITWRRFSEDGLTAEIFTMNDGSDPRQITNLGVMSWAPFFHPSGEYLAFATNKHGFSNFEIYLVDAEGRSEPVRVTYTEGFDGLPAFSPDGRTLAWTSNRAPGGQSQIFFADWNDSEARRLLGLTPPLETEPGITAEDLRLHVEALASEEMEGRLTGTEGERRATEYVAGIFEALGLEPAGDGGTFFQEFEFTSGVSLGPENQMRVTLDGTESAAEASRDWRPIAFSRTGAMAPAPVVFAGYGIVAPEEDSHPAYDSYVHLDVEGKWVLVFRYLPEEVTPERRQHLARYSGLRFKAMTARERGAVGLLVASGPNSRVEEQLVELSFDASLGTTSLAVVSVTDELAARMLSAAGRDLRSVQDGLDGGEPAMGFTLEGIEVAVDVDIRHEKGMGRNVLARLPGRAEGDAPSLVVGAHVDHLGRGLGMSTLARDDEKGRIHYGADDNASGVAGLLEMAEYLSHLDRTGRLDARRDIVFAAWSGEELGLLGSSHHTRVLAREVDDEADISGRVAAYLNMDMIGRLRENLILQGVGSSSLWRAEIERRNVPVGLPIATQNDSYLPTDTTSFYLKRVPVLSAFTGTHSEYHTPRDRPETLNYQGMQRITRFMTSLARSLAERPEEPDYLEMKRPVGEGGRARLRAYLGTIPDYAQGEVPGLKLGGVIGGGPAEEGGLRVGDLIVELAGRKIENIYDYTYAIEALKIGEAVTVVAVRGGERIEVQVVPRSRE